MKIDPETSVLIQVGSGFVTKGLDRSIRALASLPAHHLDKTLLWVVGKDRPTKFIKLSKQLGVQDHVKFLGGRDDVPHLLLAADLMIHPSVNEAGGIVLLEGLAAGLPVLCTAACGHAPHVQKSMGGEVLPEPFEQIQLNLTLEKLLSITNREKLSSNGLAYASVTDLYSQHERATDIIERTIGKKI
jgi:UDP-glucose:(heptosyl)LPS alpha-1,3-glucosyltransferase